MVFRYGGDQRVRVFPCTAQYRAMAFAQLTYRESLRDIETCLSAHGTKLYHMGFHEPVRRATLADANEARDWRIYADLAQNPIGRARTLYAGEDLERENTVYAFDSTTIHFGVCARRNRQKTPEAGRLALHIATDIVAHLVRENYYKTNT